MIADKKPIIGITMGDPAGIGPEIVISACLDSETLSNCVPIIIGSIEILENCASELNINARFAKAMPPFKEHTDCDTINVYHVCLNGLNEIEPGAVSAIAGMASQEYIKAACALGLSGDIDAIATAPINKESLRLAGIKHIGHTEMLAEFLGSNNPLTLFIAQKMRIFFLSRHLSLRQAIDYITRDRVIQFICDVYKAMADFGVLNPKIGVAALNPHASDGGQFGYEEQEILVPAISDAISMGIDASGPIGADSIFHLANEGYFDCVISLYHDQGHIAAKTLDFYGTVTATLNLPVLRTSVDHGTAMDIAWTGRANPTSMKSAILAAAEMLKLRTKKRN